MIQLRAARLTLAATLLLASPAAGQPDPAVDMTRMLSEAAEPAEPARPAADADAAAEIDYRALKTLGTAIERIRRSYVEEVATQDLVRGAIAGMVEQLDAHSAYYPPVERRKVRERTEGAYGGLGIRIQKADAGIRVIAVTPSSPADRAGVADGDLIVAIDGEATAAMHLNRAVERMRGEIGEPIALRVRRDGAEDGLRFEIERARIKIEVVKHAAYERVGYLRIDAFNRHTADDLIAAIDTLKDAIPAPRDGWVLDLRRNPGGLLDISVEVAEIFLDGGEIVSTRGRDERPIERLSADPGDRLDGAPLIVLIDGGSASAAEIVAGALKDHDRALVIGTRSFGKASVQSITDLGAAGALGLTVAHYHTPSGTSIHDTGITPDLQIPATAPGASEASTPARASGLENDPQLARAVSALQASTPLRQLIDN